MKRQMLRAKVHRITVTERDVDYEGSLTLDLELMQAAELLPFERIDVYDVDNGNRFSTYVIEGRRGGGQCCVNGAAARLVAVGDRLILASYTTLGEKRARRHRPRVVLVGAGNRIRRSARGEAAGVRFSA